MSKFSTEYDYPTDFPGPPGPYGPATALRVRDESLLLYCNTPATVTVVEETTTTLSEPSSASMSHTTASSISIGLSSTVATSASSLSSGPSSASMSQTTTSSISMSFGSLNATMSTSLLSSASVAVDCSCDIVAARAVAAPDTVYVTQTTNIMAAAASTHNLVYLH